MHGGLGLGLAIVRHLTELHGGTVRAESRGRNLGAKFTVSLPMAQLKVRPQISPSHEVSLKQDRNKNLSRRIDGTRVLLIEDSDDNRVLVKKLLTKSGATVFEANGAQAARALLEKTTPDVIVSDIGMPEEDGIEFIKKLRAAVGPEKDIPAIALTAYARSEEQEQIIAAGFQAHISKPVSQSTLAAEIQKLI
jgi:CheY-like chemotaxis protein